MAHIFCLSVNQAINDGNIEELRKLIRKRKHVDEPENLRWSPLHTAVKNRKDIAETLLNHSDNEVNCRTADGCTSLLLISGLPDVDLNIAKDVLDLGADPNIPNNEGMRPLHLACKRGNVELVKLLLCHQANVNCQNSNGYTPLHWAIEIDSPELIACLLAHNADANLTQAQGLNALMLAVQLKRNYVDLLVSHTQNLDALTRDGWTALLFAIHTANLRVIRTLLGRGASLTAPRGEYSPLESAVLTQQYDVFELIWQHTDLRGVSENKDFMRFVCEHCPLPRSYKHYQLIFNTDGVDLNVDGAGALFCNIFECEPPTAEAFDTAKKQYLDVIGWLLYRNVVLDTTDLENILWYFRQCPNAIEVWEVILAKSPPNITQQIVAKAVKYENYDVALLLITYCLHLTPEIVVDIRFRRDETFRRNWLKFFTPNRTEKIIGRYCTVVVYETYQVKSLLELSRDTVRKTMQDSCSTTQHFLDALAKLKIPTYLKDIIRLRIPVNKYLLQN